MVLAIPFVILLLTIVALFFLERKCYKTSIGILFILFVVNWNWHTVATRVWSEQEPIDSDSFRVLHWNICCTDSTPVEVANRILERINHYDAEVVFLTEYRYHSRIEIDSVLSLRYPFRGTLTNYMIGGSFFSRIPIDTCIRLNHNGNGAVLRCDIRLNDNPLRIYCLHLQSNNNINDILYYPDSIQGRSGVMFYLKNYREASRIRLDQTKQIIKDMTSMRTIVMGDMNDVYGSPSIRLLADNGLKDAWWDGGFGYGATFHDPLPYRIDHILYSKGLKLRSIKKDDSNGLSDHDALVAEFEILDE